MVIKKFAFVSDFDGTLTYKDFYRIIMEKYLDSSWQDLYLDRKSKGEIGVEFLNMIFGAMDLSEQELHQEILSLPLDESAIQFINAILASEWNFYVLSAGTYFYIKPFLESRGLGYIEVISMDGAYETGGIKIIPDKNSKFYSELYGIDKGKVIKDLKEKYEVVFFAGDSSPDVLASREADMTFAKPKLRPLLETEGIDFVPFDSFNQIEDHLREKGWIA